MPRRPLIAGNWKMNGLLGSVAELKKILQKSGDLAEATDLVVCPPATLVVVFAAAAKGSHVAIGGQDCHAEAAGPFTGDISAEMLADAGATMVIVGHSERRTLHHETNPQVRAKTVAAWRAGLVAIVCIGETRAERETGNTLTVIARQLDQSLPEGASSTNLVVAYEPVWAIGTGLTPTPVNIADAHCFIRQSLSKRYGAEAENIRILYGGSVKPTNAKQLLSVADVDGALVGGASLKAEEFLPIARACR